MRCAAVAAAAGEPDPLITRDGATPFPGHRGQSGGLRGDSTAPGGPRGQHAGSRRDQTSASSGRPPCIVRPLQYGKDRPCVIFRTPSHHQSLQNLQSCNAGPNWTAAVVASSWCQEWRPDTGDHPSREEGLMLYRGYAVWVLRDSLGKRWRE